jgi:protein-arginine kinase activator protein McsA
MQGGVEQDKGENTERLEQAVKCAEELSNKIQGLNKALVRGDFEEIKSILIEIKSLVADLENLLNMLDPV